jgi:tetratricopeptide (TPR) repeat protein
MKALESFSKLGNIAGLGKTLQNISVAVSTQGDLARAKRELLIAREISNALNDPYLNASITLNEGVIQMSEKQFQESIVSFSRALEIFNGIRYMESQGLCLKYLGNVYFQMGDYPAAEQKYLEAIEIFRKIDDKHKAAQTQIDYGLILKNQGRIEKAEEMLLDGIKIMTQFMDLSSLMIGYLNLGNVQSLNNSSQCLDSYNSAKQIAERLDENNITIGSLIGLGNYFANQGQFSEAEKYYMDSHTLAIKTNNYAGLGRIKGALGKLECMKKGNVTNAEKYFKDSIEILKKEGMISDLAISFNNLAAFYLSTGRKELAIEALKASREYFIQINNEVQVKYLNETLIKLGCD